MVRAGPEPASLTRSAASTPSDSAATVAISATGTLQLGDAASRVRAAAPQRRHQSCSGSSGVPHSGQESPLGVGRGAEAAGWSAGVAGAGVLVTLTWRKAGG